MPKVKLFEAIARHRVPWIQEADGAAVLEAAESAVLIESISDKTKPADG